MRTLFVIIYSIAVCITGYIALSAIVQYPDIHLAHIVVRFVCLLICVVNLIYVMVTNKLN